MIEGEYFTFAEAAKILGVSVSRTHALVKTYNVQPHEVNPRFKLIPKTELQKIPPKRERNKQNGRRLDHRD